MKKIPMTQNILSGLLLRVLIDSSIIKAMINSNTLLKNFTPFLLEKPLKTNAIQGKMVMKIFATLDTLILPELYRILKVE